MLPMEYAGDYIEADVQPTRINAHNYIHWFPSGPLHYYYMILFWGIPWYTACVE